MTSLKEALVNQVCPEVIPAEPETSYEQSALLKHATVFADLSVWMDPQGRSELVRLCMVLKKQGRKLFVPADLREELYAIRMNVPGDFSSEDILEASKAYAFLKIMNMRHYLACTPYTASAVEQEYPSLPFVLLSEQKEEYEHTPANVFVSGYSEGTLRIVPAVLDAVHAFPWGERTLPEVAEEVSEPVKPMKEFRPAKPKIRTVTLRCSSCARPYEADLRTVEKNREKHQDPICPDCRKKISVVCSACGETREVMRFVYRKALEKNPEYICSDCLKKVDAVCSSCQRSFKIVKFRYDRLQGKNILCPECRSAGRTH